VLAAEIEIEHGDIDAAWDAATKASASGALLRVPATLPPSSSIIASIIIATSDSSSTMKMRRCLWTRLGSGSVFTSVPA
jgi:hypothetical protein